MNHHTLTLPADLQPTDGSNLHAIAVGWLGTPDVLWSNTIVHPPWWYWPHAARSQTGQPHRGVPLFTDAGRDLACRALSAWVDIYDWNAPDWTVDTGLLGTQYRGWRLQSRTRAYHFGQGIELRMHTEVPHLGRDTDPDEALYRTLLAICERPSPPAHPLVFTPNDNDWGRVCFRCGLAVPGGFKHAHATWCEANGAEFTQALWGGPR